MNYLARNFDLDAAEGRVSVPPEIEESIRNLIRWAGDDPDREGLLDTPKRVARAWREYCRGYDEDPGAHRLPVGDAFYFADTDAKWGYQPDAKYDFKNKEQTALPDQTHSLHVGWRMAKQKDGSSKLGMDGHHANMAGEYLGACVWYEVLFGESVVGNAFITPGLDKIYGRFLQETAHKAVLASSTRQLITPTSPVQ